MLPRYKYLKKGFDRELTGKLAEVLFAFLGFCLSFPFSFLLNKNRKVWPCSL